MSTIESFKANMTRGGARSNQFRIAIPFPGIAGGGAGNSTKAIEFLAKAASIPESSVADVEISYRGRPVHFAGERTFQPWQINVYNDNDFTVRTAFETWVDSISNARSTNGLMNPADYQVDMEVHQLDRSDVIVKKYKFINTFPLNVSDISLSWDDNNQIQVYSVTFAYNYFENKL